MPVNEPFFIATSVSGKQFRMMLGYWPLMTVEQARNHAMEVLRQCRNGEMMDNKPHSLPVTPMMRKILERRCLGLKPDDQLFKGVSAEHIHSMAMRLGAPRFMLHDLRKLVATVGEKLGLGDAVLRRILNHTAPKTDVLHRHYVGLNEADVAEGLVAIQEALVGMMGP